MSKARLWKAFSIVAVLGSVSVAEPDHHGSPPAKDSHAPKNASTPKGAHGANPDAHGDSHASKPGAAKTPKSTPKSTPKHAPSKEGESVSADDALRMLEEGNARWAAGSPRNPNIEVSRREETAANGQKPFVTVLTCADSRLPVERLFDRGVGEVFVVRVAGNVAGDSETGTIEYGVGHLNTPLLVVMGHTKCGAVAAAASGAALHGKVAGLVDHIKPAVERARRNNPEADDKTLITLAVKENVWQSVYDLMRGSTDVRGLVSERKLKVVGAVCDIATGKVEFLGEHPWQSELLAAINAEHGTATAEAHEEEHAPANGH